MSCKCVHCNRELQVATKRFTDVKGAPDIICCKFCGAALASGGYVNVYRQILENQEAIMRDLDLITSHLKIQAVKGKIEFPLPFE